MRGWRYDQHPAYSDDLLKSRARDALQIISSRSPRELRLLIQDTRRLHLSYFEGLTPSNESYFAGNYRGSNFPGLLQYEVEFGPQKGCPARFVDAQMSSYSQGIAAKIQALDIIWADDQKSSGEKLYRLAELACAVFVIFLNIHPYADGNGHMSRYIVFSLFSMYGYHLSKFPIHPRPPITPPLAQLLDWYRAGYTGPFIKLMIDNLAL